MTYEHLGIDPNIIGAGTQVITTVANLIGQYQQLKALKQTSSDQVHIKQIELEMKQIDAEIARLGYENTAKGTASFGNVAKTAAIVGGGALAALALTQ